MCINLIYTSNGAAGLLLVLFRIDLIPGTGAHFQIWQASRVKSGGDGGESRARDEDVYKKYTLHIFSGSSPD